MKFDFYKYQALGNDYLVVDPHEFKIKLSKSFIRKICHRNFGIGSDGILYGPFFDKQMPSLKIFNPDGSEAEKSGNGVRIFAKYLFDKKYIKKNSFVLKTKGGDVEIKKNNPQATSITALMGKLIFASNLVPIRGKNREVINEKLKLDGKVLKINCLSIGNPHCVIISDKISKKMALDLGPKIENHNLFPKKINVEFVRVLNKKTIQLEVWERGAGYTLACGTGASASAGVCYKLGLTNSKIKAIMPGGKAEVEVLKNFEIKLTGNVSFVAQGYLNKKL